jgi:hypothetical protein
MTALLSDIRTPGGALVIALFRIHWEVRIQRVRGVEDASLRISARRTGEAQRAMAQVLQFVFYCLVVLNVADVHMQSVGGELLKLVGQVRLVVAIALGAKLQRVCGQTRGEFGEPLGGWNRFAHDAASYPMLTVRRRCARMYVEVTS